MCSAIVLGNTRFLIFIPHSLEFLVVWREDPRLLQSFVLVVHCFLPYSVYAIYLDYYHVLLEYV